MTDTPAIIDIPDGFEPHFRKSPLTDPWEPLYSKRTDKAVIIGLRLAKPHTNGRGLVHGGLITALADNAMGYSCAQAMGWQIVAGDNLAVGRFRRQRADRPVARGRDRGNQGRQHDLLCAKPDQGGWRRDRPSQRHVPCGAEEGADGLAKMPIGDLGHEIDEGAHFRRQ